MMIERSAKIYGIIFGSIAFFLLVFAGSTNLVYKKRIRERNHSYMEKMNVELSSYTHQSVSHRFVKRAINGQQESYEFSGDQNVPIFQSSWILLLELVEYGLPLKFLALYDETGMLKGIKFLENHIFSDRFEENFWERYYGYGSALLSDVKEDFIGEKYFMNALLAGSHYVQEQEREHGKK